MGCGASADRGGGGGGGAAPPKPITEAQLKTMCLDGCIRMEIACIKFAFSKSEEIQIKPPPAIEELRGCIKALEDQAASLKDTKGPVSGGGMMGGMINAAAGVAGQAAGMGMDAVVVGLKGVTDKLDEPFQTVAKDVVAAKGPELYNICVAFINGFKFAEPIKIVRGDAPWSEAQYKNVPPDTISTTMMTLAAQPLCQQMCPTVKAAIKDHLVTTGWDKAWKAYDAAYKKIATVVKEDMLLKAGVKPVTCDLDVYITFEIFKALEKYMKEEEGRIRANSAGKDIHKPGKPVGFAAVFSTQTLTEDSYKAWEMENVQ